VGNSPLFANVIELSQSKAIASAVGGKLVKHDTVATKGRTEKQIEPKKQDGEVLRNSLNVDLDLGLDMSYMNYILR